MAVQAGALDALSLPAVALFRQGLAAAIDRAAPDAVRAIQETGNFDAVQQQALLDALSPFALSLVQAPVSSLADGSAAP
jgi:F0F1-type ATP synthase alpha subunit